jgi:predicted phage baseplate assembly protein
MSTTAYPLKLDPCGCCEVDLPQPEVFNRPGLPTLAYRIGTHPTFLRRALARLPSQSVPSDGPDGARPLAALTIRSSDDPAIALLDAWATSADVLTFYQERIANEGYLRTATERPSVLQLARTIDYELNPGVAANAFLAFTVEDTPGTSSVATVSQGTKVQNLPEQGQLPQTFETDEEITTRAEWNTLRPRLTRPQELAIREAANGKAKLYLLGISTSFAAGTYETIDAAQFYPLDPATPLPATGVVQAVEVKQVCLTGMSANFKAGGLLLLVGKRGSGGVKTLTKRIKRVEEEPELTRTRIELEDNPPKPSFTPPPLEVATIVLDRFALEAAHVDNVIRKQTWRERDLTAFLAIQGWSRRNMLGYINKAALTGGRPSSALVEGIAEAARAEVAGAQLVTTEVARGVFAFKAQVGFFGHNAPRQETLPKPDNTRGGTTNDPYQNSWDGTNPRTIWTNSQGSGYANADVYLERSLPEIVSGEWVVVENTGASRKTIPYQVSDVSEESLVDYGMGGKATGLSLRNADGSSPLKKEQDFKVRRTTAYVQSESLELAQLPIEQPVVQGTTELQLDRMVLGLQEDQPLALSGEREDLSGVTNTEIVILSNIRHTGGYTVLSFEEGLRHPYVRKTVTLNANVARTTHGETVVEVLGSGDGAQSNQRFVLKKPPLTYVSASTASGSRSTLRVRVDGILWEEAPRLYGSGGRSENYIVRMEDGKAHVIFGDGEAGARLFTGVENVVATYRTGIGLPGMIGADKLTLLQTRPPGIRSVTNPLPTTDAAEPESRDSARANAPLTVLVLDRIVSLRDFEDFARGFSGVGKARAVALWKDRMQLVHITIAAAAPTATPDEDGATSALSTNVVESTSPVHANLVEAIRSASDPSQRFRVASYRPLFFNVKARVLVNPRHSSPTVLGDVETALKTAFSFERRAFGQPAMVAEIVATIQGVDGVLATDLDQLYRYQQNVAPPAPDEQITPPILDVQQVRQEGDVDELLLINPVGIKLEEMTS